MLSNKIKAKAIELGYTACGIIPAAPFDEYTKELDKRSELFPESKKHYDHYHYFYDLPENGKSIIVCTQRYNRYKMPKDVEAYYGKMYLFDNRVSYTEEHRINTEFEAYIKMLGINILESTIPSRLAGARAGLGKFGYNNFLYDDKDGSFIIIETWVVDKELDYDDVPDNIYLSACTDNCRRCIDACPTKALSDKLLMDTGKCITRIQIDENDASNIDFCEHMDVWIYGCDACQDACPVNKDKFTESADYPLLSEFTEFMKPESIVNMDEDTYKNVLNPRFWYAGEDKLWLWKCNALRSMIHSGDSKYFSLIKENCDNADERIKEVAKWGCKKLGI